MTKQQARAAARSLRRELAPQWAALGTAMARQLFMLPVWRQAAAVLCFASLPDEPDTDLILREALAAGKHLYLPRVLPDGGMETVPVTDLGLLVCGAFGIREPNGPAAPLPPDALVLAPCLAADENGVRLGRGGGYYDRFLAGFAGQKLLLCPTALVFPTLPRDEWDARFVREEILTEHGLFNLERND